MRLCVVVATRPNFIKAAPLLAVLNGKAETTLVHTGQHYDYAMSQVFFEQLELPKPDVHLGIGSGSHAEQTGRTMMAMEKVIIETKPDALVVFGDVNATVAASLAAVKVGVPVAHIEAGVRSFDTMPEEVNRRLTDHVSRWLFTTSQYEDTNLTREGLSGYRVGNIVADTLLSHQSSPNGLVPHLGLRKGFYALMTLHRAGNVDGKDRLSGLLGAVSEIARGIPLVFPVHPRTMNRIKDFGLDYLLMDVITLDPLGYLSMIDLEANARFVMTDSGGVQVETSVLGVPCLTILDSPVWPVTHDVGTNILVGTEPQKLIAEAYRFINGKNIGGKVPDLWDGHTAERIAEVLTK